MPLPWQVLLSMLVPGNLPVSLKSFECAMPSADSHVSTQTDVDVEGNYGTFGGWASLEEGAHERAGPKAYSPVLFSVLFLFPV